MKRNLTLLIATALMLSCSGTTSSFTPADARKAVSVACTGVAIFIPASELPRMCDYMWSIAHGIRTFEGGRVPTPQEMQEMIARFAPAPAPGGIAWKNLGAAITMIWGSAYPLIGGDVKLALDWLEAIAGGVEDFAVNCKTPTPTPSS